MTENFMVLSLIEVIQQLPNTDDNSKKILKTTLPEIINKCKFFKVLDIRKLIDSKKRLPPIKVTESNCSKGENNKDIVF